MSGASRTWVHLLLTASDSCPMISLASWAGDPGFSAGVEGMTSG